jgi:hypothetical protein
MLAAGCVPLAINDLSKILPSASGVAAASTVIHESIRRSSADVGGASGTRVRLHAG